MSVGGFVPLSQAFLARLALRDVGFSRAAASAVMARRVPRRMLDEHQCCDFDSFCPQLSYRSRATKQSIFSLAGNTRITTGVSLPREALMAARRAVDLA